MPGIKQYKTGVFGAVRQPLIVLLHCFTFFGGGGGG